MKSFVTASLVVLLLTLLSSGALAEQKPRVIVLSDAEVDDQCSMVRFLLYTNEMDVEGIITTSSQYHYHGFKWAGDNWMNEYLDGYTKVYPNLIKHDPSFPTPDYLKKISLLGNVNSEGEMTLVTPGSQRIVDVLLDQTDNSPVWIQAWGGTNTLARALKTIEESHPDKMEYVASKLRFFFIWEQDNTYQSYILPHWGKYNILTIISDQFWSIAYDWTKITPSDKQTRLKSAWMNANIIKNHGELCAAYKAMDNGDFRSEGDSPSYFHAINTGLRNMENPNWGGWGGRYVKVRNNTWLDSVPQKSYTYPSGRWYTLSAWGRCYMRDTYPKNSELMNAYFDPLVRWFDVLQNDFAARADWCVKPFNEANHPPVPKSTHDLDIKVKRGETVAINATGTTDPDGNTLSYKWSHYKESGTFAGSIEITGQDKQEASFSVPASARISDKIHAVCEITDNGTPQITRYLRVIATVDSGSGTAIDAHNEQVLQAGMALYNNKVLTSCNKSLHLDYSVSDESHIRFELFDCSGRKVAVLIDEIKQAGMYNTLVNMSGIGAGSYMYTFTSNNKVLNGKVFVF
jgi:hypothetical protein